MPSVSAFGPRREEMAVGEGFEPPVGYSPTAVFKTAAIGHSAIPPRVRRAATHASATPAPKPRRYSAATASNTSFATKIGAPVCTDNAIASEGRQSIVRSLPDDTAVASRCTSTSIA
jgi:cell division septation protein DedD